VKVRTVLPLAILAALGYAGCGQPPAATFAVNHQKLDPLIPEARSKVDETLSKYFGTPNELVAWKKFTIDYGAGDAKLPEGDPRHDDGWRLIEGRHLYMQHCVHCHGVAGDGDGPTARFLNPRPRDYRQGIFKFKSTLYEARPSREDLKRTLDQGIPGTYMPSFVLLGDEKLLLIIDYVRWLSIRGSMEIKLSEELSALFATKQDIEQTLRDDQTKKLTRAAAVADVMKSVEEGLPGLIEDIAATLADDWKTADLPETAIAPTVKRTPPTKDSIDRGRELFLSKVPGKKTECLECHGVSGRGDGGNTEKFWPIPGTKPERKYEEPGLHDIWGHAQSPRDLTRGIYRGGRRPVDIYRRVHQGIPGTQMPPFGKMLKPEEIWDVVNYVLSIPFDGEQAPYPSELNDEDEGKHKVAATKN
jgi:mono/diheme cytochrome c family protein